MACSYLVGRLPVAKLDKKGKQKQRKRGQNFAKVSEKKKERKRRPQSRRELLSGLWNSPHRHILGTKPI